MAEDRKNLNYEVEGEECMEQKRELKVLLSVLVILGSLLLFPLSVFATQSRSDNFDKSYSLGNNQVDNLVNVAQKQIGKRKSELGYTEAWCADFVCDCAKLTGMADNIIPYNYGSRGACTSLYNYMLNNCSARSVSSREKGDIIFYYCSGCGRYVHTGIVLDGTYSIEGNYDGKVTKVKNSYTDSAGHKLSSGTITRKYLRPNYSPVNNFVLSVNKSGQQPVFNWNAVEGAAKYHLKIWKGVIWDGNPYVAYWGETGTNKWAALPTGTYQAYVDAELGDGTLIMSNVVEFTVGGTGLDFGAYVHGSQVEFQWAGQNASSYNIKIWKDTMVWDGDPYKAYWGETGSSKWISLPIGTYRGYIDADFGNGSVLMSNVVEFRVDTDPDPSYSDFSISQSVYSLHDKIEFKINPINSTGIGISIDKEGVGRVVAEGCNGTNGHTLWGIGLGVGNYSAHITVYNDEKWVDTDTVYFSVVPPTYSNLEINKKKVGTAEEAKFNISTSHAEFMVLKIDREGEGCVYTERCWDSLDSWSVKADTLGVGQYKAHFLVFSTNDYYIETEEIPFSIYQSPERSKLSCLPGDSHTKTIFQWEKAAYTTYYDLRIDAADYETGGNIKNVWQLRGNRCSVWLPAGEYAAHVDSVNEDGAVGGELIYFTVKEGEGTPTDLGEEIKTEIVTAKGSSLITNTGKEVKLESGDKENINQIWKFTKQEDGSYVISSEAGKGVLTAPDEAGANISIAKYQKQDNQKWKVYGDEEGYVLQSVGTGYVIGLSGKDEAILGGYALKYSDDQMFLFKEAGVITNKPVLFLSQDDGRLVASVFNTDHVTEYGFVYGNQTDITLETPGRTRVAYSNLDSNGSYSLDATELTDCMIRAYAAYTDEDGATRVIYSDSIKR